MFLSAVIMAAAMIIRLPIMDPHPATIMVRHGDTHDPVIRVSPDLGTMVGRREESTMVTQTVTDTTGRGKGAHGACAFRP